MWNEVVEVLPLVIWLWVSIEEWMDELLLLASRYMPFRELVIYRSGTYITSWVSAAWCVDRSLLRMMGVGSSPSIIAFPLVENGLKVLDNCTGSAWRGVQFTPTIVGTGVLRNRTRMNLECSRVWQYADGRAFESAWWIFSYLENQILVISHTYCLGETSRDDGCEVGLTDRDKGCEVGLTDRDKGCEVGRTGYA